jgi:hypothetical protein
VRVSSFAIRAMVSENKVIQCAGKGGKDKGGKDKGKGGKDKGKSKDHRR